MQPAIGGLTPTLMSPRSTFARALHATKSGERASTTETATACRLTTSLLTSTSRTTWHCAPRTGRAAASPPTKVLSVKALPKLARAASHPELRAAFTDHLQETQIHAERVEQVFKLIGERVRGKHCEGMAGIIEEGKAIMEEEFEEPSLDAALNAAGQRAEHYEMAAYGTLVAWAEVLGLKGAAELLQRTLEEEGAADKKLSALADGGINRAAGAGDQLGRRGKSQESMVGRMLRSVAGGPSASKRPSGRRAAKTRSSRRAASR
jgi:ferritin-like metal-binding protein YciE